MSLCRYGFNIVASKLFAICVLKFVKNLVDNNQNGTSKKNEENYVRCYRALKDCITLSENSKQIMDFDMSFVKDYIRYRTNWYRLIYDELVIYERSFTNLLSTAKRNSNALPELSGGTFLRSQTQVALFFTYRLHLGLNDDFEKNVKQIAEMYGYTSATSIKQLREKYAACRKTSPRTRPSTSNTKDLRNVIAELKRLKLSTEIADQELQQASRETEI